VKGVSRWGSPEDRRRQSTHLSVGGSASRREDETVSLSCSPERARGQRRDGRAAAWAKSECESFGGGGRPEDECDCWLSVLLLWLISVGCGGGRVGAEVGRRRRRPGCR
jgi:hypothetical protein